MRDPDWRDVLWREWLHGDDRRVASTIYEHLAGERPRDEAYALLGAGGGLLGALCGAGLALAVALFATGRWTASWVAGAAVAGLLLGLAVSAVGSGRIGSWKQMLEALRALHTAALAGVGLGFLTALVSERILEGLRSPHLTPLSVAFGASGWVTGVLAALARLPSALRTEAPPVTDGADHRVHPPWPKLLWWWPRRATEAARRRAALDPAVPQWAREALTAPRSVIPVDELVTDLEHGPPRRRETAYRELRKVGTMAIAPVLRRTTGSLAIRLAREIADEANRARPPAPQRRVCRDCLCRFSEVSIPAGRRPVVFYACRSCHDNEHYIEHPGPIIAVLDSDGGGDPRPDGNALLVNWLARARAKGFEGSELFDWDSVEIVRATDQEVEHFLVDVANDTDAKRAKGYRDMRCVVGSECALSEGTLRKLRGVFGFVEVRGRRRP